MWTTVPERTFSEPLLSVQWPAAEAGVEVQQRRVRDSQVALLEYQFAEGLA
jgi:hypothetical protein